MKGKKVDVEQMFDTCRRCGRKLKSIEAMRKGYGRTCEKYLSCGYPGNIFKK